MLFRPEEVVLPSSASPVDDGFLRMYFDQAALANLDVNPVNAMSTSIVQGYTVVIILAADQQQEVHRSRNPKALPRVQGHRMKGEPKPFGDLLVALGQGVVGGSPPVLD